MSTNSPGEEFEELGRRMLQDAVDNGELMFERVPAPDVRQLVRAAVGREVGEVFSLHATQEALDGLAEQVADMLDNALHLEACWISEDETRCVCIIGQLRAVLPRCGHVENVGVKGLTRQCLSIVHPSAPYKHVFGTV